MRGHVARRPQAVAIHAGADGHPVAEGHHRRSVPRFLDGAEVLVEVDGRRADGETRAALVGLGDHHHQRLQRIAPGADEELEHLVEAPRVAAVGMDRREQLRHALAPHGMLELRVAGAGPGEVAGKRVDLAVVGQKAHRLRQAPLRQGVGAETAVEDREAREKRGVAQVRVEVAQPAAAHHALVDDRARRQRTDVEVVEPPYDGLPLERSAYAASGEEQAPLHLLAAQVRRRDDDLLDVRPVAPGQRPQRLRPHRHRPPAGHGEALVGEDLLHELSREAAFGFVAGQEEHADGERLPRRQARASRRELSFE